MASVPLARLAFVGAGRHSTGSLYPNIPLIPEFDLVAVCDLDAAKASYVARQYGAEAFTDVTVMLDKVQPHGVCVCGPPEMHYEVGKIVLGRGVPIFIEKPPAPTLEQTRELARLARENGAWGMVGFMKRFAPANVVAKEYMGSAAFGGPSSISLIHGSGPYNDTRRMLMFNGIHMVDLARYFCGDVASVFAFGSTEDVQAASIAMRFASGVVGQLNMNSGHTWPDCFEQAYISGSEAGILIDASKETHVMSPAARFAEGEGYQLFGWGQRYHVSGNTAGWEAGGHYTRGYWGELSHFARAVLGQAGPVATLDDGVAAMAFIEAVMESLGSGQPAAL